MKELGQVSKNTNVMFGVDTNAWKFTMNALQVQYFNVYLEKITFFQRNQ